MGLFGGTRGAKFSDGGVYILPGVGRVEIQKITYKKTRKGQDAFIVEVKYLESNNPMRPVGSLATWMVTLDKEPAMGNIRQFVETIIPASKAVFDRVCTTPAEVAQAEADCDALIMGICAEANPLKGHTVRFCATEIETKAKRPFTKVKWLDDNMSAADVAKEAAAA